MAKTRETPCLYYICAGQCKKGRQADHNPDYENIRYTLFKSVEDELGSHGEEVEKGIIPIYWDNEEV